MIPKKITLLLAAVIAITVTMFGGQAMAKAMNGGRAGMSAAQAQAVADRKAAIQQKITSMKQERVAKLDAKRLAVCQQRQQKINDIFAQGTTQNTKQLAVFQQIEANVKQFYLDKKLSSPDYAAALAAADAAESNAVAAIEVAASTTFSCSTTDPTNPGSVIKEVMTTRHTALAAYRTAIKNLILVVRKANGQQTTSNTTSPSSTTNTTKE